MTKRIGKPDTDADIELRGMLDRDAPANFIMKAGAGSGKTTSLIKALDAIRANHGSRLRSNGQRIACITYTEIAAQEISDDVGNDELMHVSTIHSFLWSVINPFQADVGVWVESYIRERLVKLHDQRSSFTGRHSSKTVEKNRQDIKRLEQDLTIVRSVPKWGYGTGSSYSDGTLGHSDILRMVPQLILEKDLLAKVVSRRFPYILVDESQDTMLDVVNALKRVSVLASGDCCLGFFGDPMQQIFANGVGSVIQEPGWKSISKQQNYRNPPKILQVINKIRALGDGLQQTSGQDLLRSSALRDGEATLIILPASQRTNITISRTRQWLAENFDDGWECAADEQQVKILVVVHKMAAMHLGFLSLFEAFNKHSGSLSMRFNEGTSWPLRPFLGIIIPLVSSFQAGRDSEVMQILLDSSPPLKQGTSNSEIPDLLLKLKSSLSTLAQLMNEDGVAVRDILVHLKEGQILELDDRLINYLDAIKISSEEEAALHESERQRVSTMRDFLASPAKEIWAYAKYVNEQSPFSTQQGIKGAEFERVLVLVDDEDGRHPFFSYDRYFGITPPSSTDQQNEKAGRETIADRTRRLFYVCCSRAMRHLAVVIYTADVTAAKDVIIGSGLFSEEQIYLAEALVD